MQTDLQTQFDTESAALTRKLEPLSETLETISIKPRKTDILVQLVSFAWAPYWQDERNSLTPAW